MPRRLLKNVSSISVLKSELSLTKLIPTRKLRSILSLTEITLVAMRIRE